MSLITSPWPYFGDDEIEAVKRVLRSGKINYWTGDEGRLFEQEFADYCGSKHAIALANGTVALELALYALNIGPGDEVIVPSRTFIASASAVVMRGAIPVTADVDFESQNVTVDAIKPLITPKTKAIVVVHLAGWPCDMNPIIELAKTHGIKIIEDCAQATGAKYKGKPVGSLGDIGAFSFCQDKIMTTGGEGGMLVTNNGKYWKKAWAYKDHGKSYETVYNKEHSPGFRWLHESFGTNWRMIEMQAAIGRIQLKRMLEWHELRKRNAQILIEHLKACDAIRIPLPEKETEHAWYKFYVFVKPEKLKPEWDRDSIMNGINVLGVPCTVGSCSEIYLEKAFDNTGYRPQNRLPVAQELGETSLMFLVHPTLTEKDMLEMAQIISKVFLKATE